MQAFPIEARRYATARGPACSGVWSDRGADRSSGSQYPESSGQSLWRTVSGAPRGPGWLRRRDGSALPALSAALSQRSHRFYDNQYTISYDRSFRNDKDKITGTWFWDEGSVAKPFGTDTTLTNPRNDFQWNRYLAITHTHLFSPTKVNELRVGYSRFMFGNIPTDSHQACRSRRHSQTASFPASIALRSPGLFSLGTGVNDDRGTISNTYNIVETFSMITGKHSLRMGGEAVQYQLNRFNNFAVRGSLTFGAHLPERGNTFYGVSRTSCAERRRPCSQPLVIRRETSSPRTMPRSFRTTIATRPRLTFNFGMRWEAMSFGHDKLNRAGIYDPALAAAGQNPFLIPEAVNLGGFTGTPGVRDCALDAMPRR